jgi:hypothetical protein
MIQMDTVERSFIVAAMTGFLVMVAAVTWLNWLSVF